MEVVVACAIVGFVACVLFVLWARPHKDKVGSERAEPAPLVRRPQPERRPQEVPVQLAADEILVMALAGNDSPPVAIARPEALRSLERAGLAKPPNRSRPFQQLFDRWRAWQDDEQRSELESLANQSLEGRWLELTDESARELERGKMVRAKSGDLLGMLNDPKGRRRYNLRFSGAEVVPSPSMALAAANLQAILAMQAQLEAIEERLVEVQRTLEQLAKDIDVQRLAEISAASEVLEDVVRQIRRRGRMRPSDWDRAVAAELDLRSAVKQADWSLDEIMKEIPDASSRHERVDVLQDILNGGRLEYWLTVLADVQLARTRWDLVYLLHEATAYPDELGDLKATTRSSITKRQEELFMVGRTLREVADPRARRWRDHIQQHSHFKLRQKRKVVAEILERNPKAFPDKLPTSHDVS